MGVDVESGEQGYGLGIASGALEEPCRCRLDVELGHAPRVERNDAHLILGCHDEHSGGARGCRLSSVVAQPGGLFG